MVGKHVIKRQLWSYPFITVLKTLKFPAYNLLHFTSSRWSIMLKMIWMIYNILNISCYKYYNLYIFFPYTPPFAKVVSTHVNAKKILNTLADFSRLQPHIPWTVCPLPWFGVTVMLVYFDFSAFSLEYAKVVHIFIWIFETWDMFVHGFMQWFIPMSCRISMTLRTRYRM